MLLASEVRHDGRCPIPGRRLAARASGSGMNTHLNYTLASRPETGRFLRGWALLTHGTFSGGIIAVDVALIVAMSCLTGIGYHLAAYDEIGDIPSFVRSACWRRASS